MHFKSLQQFFLSFFVIWGTILWDAKNRSAESNFIELRYLRSILSHSKFNLETCDFYLRCRPCVV